MFQERTFPCGEFTLTGATGPANPAASAPQLQIVDLTRPTRPPRTVLSGIPVSQPTWAPDSRWLVVAWSAADQWWFVRATGRPHVIAESRVGVALGRQGAVSRGGPLRLDGWCCAP